jgi:hypothetical protein
MNTLLSNENFTKLVNFKNTLFTNCDPVLGLAPAGMIFHHLDFYPSGKCEGRDPHFIWDQTQGWISFLYLMM